MENTLAGVAGLPRQTDAALSSKPLLSNDAAAQSWQLRLHLTEASEPPIDCIVTNTIELGIAPVEKPSINLTSHNGVRAGVSRRHIQLKAADNWLYVIDLGSTNGTQINDGRIRPYMPYPLKNGDRLSLGNLEMRVEVLMGCEPETKQFETQVDLIAALSQIAKAIASKLDLDEILPQALETVTSFAGADEATIWLIDAESNALVLEAERGIHDDNIRRLRLPVTDNHVAAAISTRKPVRASKAQGAPKLKIKTGYLVDALLYVPLMNEDKVVGVIGAAHQQSGKQFSLRDERLLSTIADFVAVAVQNARRYADLQQSDRLKTELIQNISHEFRTPLTYIVGYTSLLAEGATNLRPEQTQTLDIVLQQTSRLTRMIDSFVTLEAAEEAARKCESIDIANLLKTAVMSAQIAARDKQITLKTELHDPLPRIQANPLALNQVLDNLLYNAFKFTPERGTVTLAAHCHEAKSELEVSVADTGIGIPEKDLEHIFDRYYRVEGPEQSRHRGSGLGLAICKKIIEAHRGRIAVSSTPAIGTTFSFTLPVAQPQA